jgi:hypothetical protein
MELDEKWIAQGPQIHKYPVVMGQALGARIVYFWPINDSAYIQKKDKLE